MLKEMSRKLFVFLVAAGLVASATVAMAANGDLTSLEVNIAAEEAANYTAGDGTHLSGVLTYTLGTSYVNNDTITFTLSAGTFDDAAYYLATQADLTDGGSITASPNGKTPFAMISGGNGSNTVTFRVTDDTAEIDNNGSGTANTSALAAGVAYRLVSAADGSANPLVDVSSLVTPGTINVTVASETSTGLPLDSAGDKTEPLFNSYTQFSADVATPADQVIDVEAQRKSFVGPATTDTIVLSLVSDNVTDFVNQITDGEQITIADNDTVTVTITGDLTGVDSISDGTYDYTLDKSSTPNTASITYTAEEITALNGEADFGDGNETLTLTLTATVDATTVLNTRSFTATVATDLEDAAQVDATLLNAAAAGSWTMNGMQAKVPYMAFNADGFLSFIKVVNESTQNADLSVDATVWDVTADTQTTYSNVSIKQIDASSSMTVSEAELKTALGLNDTDIYHVALTITVNGPVNDVQVTAFQKDSVGRTVLQVLYNTGNESDGRVWQ